jgi:hypothetical protein
MPRRVFLHVWGVFAALLLGSVCASWAVTIGWDAPAGSAPTATPPEEIRYLVEEKAPGATSYTRIFPALPLTQRTYAKVLPVGGAGQQHCFQVYTVRITPTTNAISESSAAGTLQSDPTQTALCVPLPVVLGAPGNFRIVP